MLLRSLSFAIALALPAVASAQTAADLDQVVVTATRTSTTVADACSPVRVIDRDAIERSQARDLPDLLRGRAGIDPATRAARARSARCSCAAPNRPVGAGRRRAHRFGDRGPGVVPGHPGRTDRPHRDRARPALEPVRLGSGRRRDPDLHPPRPGRVRATLPRRNRQQSPARSQRRHRPGGNERGWYGADFAWQRTDGINACLDRRRCSPAASSTNLTATATATPRSTCARRRPRRHLVKFEGTAACAEAFNEYDGSPYGGNEADNVAGAVGEARLDAFATRRGERAARPQRRRLRQQLQRPRRRHDPRRHPTRIAPPPRWGDFRVADGQPLSVGADWQRDRGRDMPFRRPPRDNTGGVRRIPRPFGAQQWQTSLRNDDNEQFGATPPAASAGAWLRPGLQAHGELRHRVQGADLQRPVLPVLQQPRPEAGNLAQREPRPLATQGTLELDVERLRNRASTT